MNREENERLCRVGPGTVMNAVFKRYWLPVATSEELRDREPMQVTALGEHYVLFREGSEVALLREHCAHRAASLCLGRVEEGGIRCIYHGWKFASDGAVVDMPNAPDDRFKSRYRQPAYSTREIGGLVWVYLGPPELMPPEPDYMWLKAPAANRVVTPVFIDCNYTQSLEGLLDSSHLGILHGNAFVRDTEVLDGEVMANLVAERTPEVDVEETPFGFYSVAIRRGADGARRARISAYIAPSMAVVPGGPSVRGAWAWVLPIDDEHCLFFAANYDLENEIGVAPKTEEMRRFQGIDANTLDRLGYSRSTRHRPDKAARHNYFYQDREAMKSGKSFTGLDLFLPEDIAVTASMLPIPDRSTECLLPSDAAILRLRRTLLQSAEQVESGGAPVGIDSRADTTAILVTEGDIPHGANWQQLLPA